MRRVVVVGCGLVWLVLTACGGDSDVAFTSTGGAAGQGSGGAAGAADGSAGGAAGSGGSGGSTPTGGSGGTGGSTPTGGSGGTGGSTPTGGSGGTGGSAPTGGSGGTGGSTPTGGNGGTGGTPPTPSGCADGHREAFVDAAKFPNVAGCAGGFQIPGTTTPASQQPACNRKAGDDGPLPNGVGCSIDDLCAEGWHVCKGAGDVAVSSGNQGCAPDTSVGFWLTRQAQTDGGACAAPPAQNNPTGCGGFGLAVPPSCSPLNASLRYSTCDANPPWKCGGAAEYLTEAAVVTKSGPGAGGVICCKN